MRLIIIGIILLLIVFPTFANEDDVIIITVEGGDSWRSIAEKYLGDANQWEYLIKFNGLKDQTLKKGQKLRIPVGIVHQTRQQITTAQDAIEKAIDSGAQFFANESLIAAQDLLKQAQNAIQDGQYYTAQLFAVGAGQKADFAYELTQSQITKGVEAILSNYSGSVETRGEEDLSWKKGERNMKLYTNEKIRTFERSHADVIFLQGNMLRIEENSLAVVKELQLDVRRRKAKASVVLLEGDLALQLQGLSDNDDVEVITATGVSITGISKEYAVDIAEEDKSTRVAVYDEGGIDVSSAGKTVRVGQFQGTRVGLNQQPEAPRDLLPAPLLSSPRHRGRLTQDKITFKWKEVPGAKWYNITVGKDPQMKNRVLHKKRIKTNQYQTQTLSDGTYYWQVQAVDFDDFEGIPSPAWEFAVYVNSTPPPLTILKPHSEQKLTTPEVVVEGKTESNTKITINQTHEFYSKSDGTFHYPIQLNEGKNQLTITVHGLGGLQTTQTLIVYRNTTPPKIQLNLSKQDITTNVKVFPINGQITPLTGETVRLTINEKPVSIDTLHQFNTTIVLDEGKNEVLLIAENDIGQTDQKHLTITLDTTPPRLTLQQPNRQSPTNQKEINFKGTIEGAQTLTLNDDRILFANTNTFEKKVALQEGKNQLTFIATDVAGNETIYTETIVCDTQPPQLLSYAISPNVVNGGEMVELRVYVNDSGSGVQQTITYILKGDNDFTLSGVLPKFGDGIYQDQVRIPNRVRGRIYFESIMVRDYLGNRKEYQVNN